MFLPFFGREVLCGLAGALILGLFLSIEVRVETPTCPTDARGMVKHLITSLHDKEFELVKATEFIDREKLSGEELDYFDSFGLRTDGNTHLQFIEGQALSGRRFEVYFGSSRGVGPGTVDLTITSRAFSDSVEIRENGDLDSRLGTRASVRGSFDLPEPFNVELPHSQAVLEIRSDRKELGKRGYISGFLMENTYSQGDLIGFRWFFIEPVRALLKPLVQPNNIYSDCTDTQMDDAFPKSEYTHIVYPIYFGRKCKLNLDFKIILDPFPSPRPISFSLADLLIRLRNNFGITKTSSRTETFPLHVEMPVDGLSICSSRSELDLWDGPVGSTAIGLEIPFVLIADEAFRDLYDTFHEEKTWEDGLLELANMVDAFYSTKFPKLTSDAEEYEPFRLNLKSLESWTNSGTSSIRNDAYSQMCQFAENLPSVLGPNRHQHGGDTFADMAIVHMATALDLGPLPAGRAVDDSIGGFCPGTSCGSDGQDIAGISEGVGGLKTADSTACSVLFRDYADRGRRIDFIPGHHSLSQQGPDLPQKFSLNENYNGLLYQRFLLITHEMGHTLGALHSDASENTMMRKLLNGSIRFLMTDANMGNVKCKVGSSRC